MAEKLVPKEMVESIWREYMTTGQSERERRQRRLFARLPHDPRCRSCQAPFEGAGGAIVKMVYGKQRSKMNPNLCNVCERFIQEHPGGAEIELSLLFADVRGSTALAERMSPTEFSKLINHFYNVAAQVLVQSDALIDKIIGDQAAGIYVPGIAGAQHARRAIEAARQILRATGHQQPEGPWVPLGIGVHTGIAFIGSVTSEAGTSDITVLGDVPNTAARLATSAGPGEILISEAAFSSAGLDLGNLETRQLSLKGKSETVLVHVLSEFAVQKEPAS